MDVPPADQHPAQRWITATFGSTDPFAIMEDRLQGCGWRLTAEHDGRTVTEKQVFTVLQVTLDQYEPAPRDLNTLARVSVRVVQCARSADVAAAALKSLLRRWPLPADELAHVVSVLARIARNE